MSLHEEKPSRTCFPGSLSFLLVLKLNWSKKLQPWDKYPSSRNIHPPGTIPLARIFTWTGSLLFSRIWQVSQEICPQQSVYAKKCCMFPHFALIRIHRCSFAKRYLVYFKRFSGQFLLCQLCVHHHLNDSQPSHRRLQANGVPKNPQIEERVVVVHHMPFLHLQQCPPPHALLWEQGDLQFNGSCSNCPTARLVLLTHVNKYKRNLSRHIIFTSYIL